MLLKSEILNKTRKNRLKLLALSIKKYLTEIKIIYVMLVTQKIREMLI